MLLFLLAPAHALPLAVERFDATTLPDGWKTTVYSQTGGGAQSKIVVDSGALLFTAEAQTRRFSALSKKFPLRDVVWLRVSARVKTEGVGSTGPICGMYVRFENEPARSAGGCPAAGEYSSVVRTFPVPQEAHDVEVGFALTGAGKAWVDELLVEPVTPEWRSVGKGNITYHWLATDTPREEQFTANEEDYERYAAFFGITSPVRIAMYKYTNLETMQEYTGTRADTVIVGSEFHSLYRTGGRHLAHMLGRPWGDPPPLIADGLAVHLDGEWDGRDAKSTARGLTGRGEAPSLAVLLDPTAFADTDPQRAYPLAGAFMQWVVERHGPAAAKALYALRAGASVADNTRVLEAALGANLAAIEAEWRTWL